MKNRSIIICCLISLLTIGIRLPAMAQEQAEVIINHKLPDVQIAEIINDQAIVSNTKDFRGKLLILDFWATFCSPCVSLFPKADSLEKQFKGAMAFLPITTESRLKASEFFKHMYSINYVKPKSVVNDAIFNKMFPHASIPYYVWINAQGVVIAMTGAEQITAKRIQAVIDGKEPNFENADGSKGLRIDFSKSLFHLSTDFITGDSTRDKYDLPQNLIAAYSIATKSVPTIKGHFHSDMDRFLVYNMSVRLLYQLYYDCGYYDAPVQGAFDPDSRHDYDFKDSILLNKIQVTREANLKPGSKEMIKWFKDNAVCFEMIFPKNLTWKEKMDLVKQDLDRYFGKPMGFSTYVEQRLDSNLRELKISKGDTFLHTAGGISEERHDRYFYSQRNMSIDHFLGVLNGYFFQKNKVSFINKSGLTTSVDLELNCDMANLNSINEALKKYGLYFNKEPAKIDVLVFSDRRKIK